MADTEKGALFGPETEKIINTKLMGIEARLKNDLELSYKELYNLVLEANSLILMITGDDFESYEMWKYRLFVSPDNRIYLTQGTEVDTDYVPADYKPLDGD